MKWGVVVFPGSNDDRDTLYALDGVLGFRAEALWHRSEVVGDVDALVLPGGFSYGDYLRCGALARFSPIMKAVIEFAKAGGPVLGICNGFQILCEAELLPGALVRNQQLQFLCRQVAVRVETAASAFSAACRPGEELAIPIKHGEGCFVTDQATLRELEDNDRVVFRYAGGAPNGSLHDIAGIRNADGNVVGLMPHPEHAVDAALGSTDGRSLFRSALGWTGDRRGRRSA